MSIKIKGLSKLNKDLKKFGTDGSNLVKRNLSDSGTNIERAASIRAPSYLSSDIRSKLNISQRIQSKVFNNGFTVKVSVIEGTDLDAYVEFGTGLNASEILSKPEYSDEIRALAWTFKKKRMGTLKGTPYLFPSYFEEAPKFIAELKRGLERLAKKV